MELLTGKCKEDFEKWYWEEVKIQRKDYIKYGKASILKKFYRSMPSMQYGVLVDFFDSVDLFIGIEIKKSFKGELKGFSVSVIKDKLSMRVILYNDKNEPFKLRKEARLEIIKKANELYNQKHK